MPPNKTIWLMRHSIRADKENPEKYIHWNDCEITNEGYKLAAERASEILEHHKGTQQKVVIMYSPYRRTYETAIVVKTKLFDLSPQLQLDAMLAESHDTSTYPQKPIYSKELSKVLIKNGISYPQTLEQLSARTKELVNRLKMLGDGIYILVTHGAVYNSILSHIIDGFDLEVVQRLKPYTPRYCDLTRIESDQLTVTYTQVECVKNFELGNIDNQ